MEPMQTALIPVAQGNEDIEVIALIDVLRRGGLQVVVASLDDQELVTLMKGTRLVVDAALQSVIDQPWDVIAVPGGIPGAMNLAESSPLRDRLHRQHLSGGVVAAICLAPALVTLASTISPVRKQPSSRSNRLELRYLPPPLTSFSATAPSQTRTTP